MIIIFIELGVITKLVIHLLRVNDSARDPKGFHDAESNGRFCKYIVLQTSSTVRQPVAVWANKAHPAIYNDFTV